MARFLASDAGMARPAIANSVGATAFDVTAFDVTAFDVTALDAEQMARLHVAAVRRAQRLRRCAILQWQDAWMGALVRALKRPFRGTGRALPAPSGSVRTPPQTSRCAA